MPELPIDSVVAAATTSVTGANQLKSQANQDVVAVSAVADGYAIDVTDLARYEDPENPGTFIDADGADGLFTYLSSDPDQAALGPKEWVAIILRLEEDLLNVTWNGYALTAADKADAEAFGYNDGKTIVYWAKYEDLAGAGKTVVLGTVDGTKSDKTIVFKQA